MKPSQTIFNKDFETVTISIQEYNELQQYKEENQKLQQYKELALEMRAVLQGDDS